MLQEGKSCIFVGSECLCAGHVPSYVSRHWIIGLMREWWLNVLAQHPPPHTPPLSFQVLLLVLSSFHVCTRVCCNALRSRWMVRLQPHLPVYPIEPTSHAISTGMYQQQGAQCLLLISSSVPESEPCCLVQVLYPVSPPPFKIQWAGIWLSLKQRRMGHTCMSEALFPSACFEALEQVLFAGMSGAVWLRSDVMLWTKPQLGAAFPPLLCGARVLMSCFSECLTVVITETAKNVSLTTVCVSALVQGVSKGCFIDSVIAQ